MNTPALAFREVRKGFRRGKATVWALDGVSLEIPADSIIALLGPDGAGKSTLMRLAAGLLLPDRGDIQFPPAAAPGGEAGTGVSYMPQRFGLYEELTVQENLDLYADLQGLPKAQQGPRQEDLLRLAALGPFRQRRAGDLSGGMKQKLGVICALLRVPRLMLLDEPTVGVDPIARREIWEIISGLRAQGMSVLLSTAYFAEAEQCDQIIILDRGKLLVQCPPSALCQRAEGRCFLVREEGTPRRSLHERLQQRTGVLDARVIAEGIRVLCAKPTPLPAGQEQWQAVPAQVEDAFVELLGQEDPTLIAKVSSTKPVSPASTDKEVMVEAQDLHKFYGHFEAVKGSTFSVQRGEIFGLLGANGAGKTTTFRMLCGLLPASSGSLRIAGVDMRRATAAARARIGYVAQKFALYDDLSTLQNLQFFASAYGLRGARRRTRLDWALQTFALHDYTGDNVSALPLGIKQRLALSCALLHEPAILFLDEPTSGVDPLTRRAFWQQIHQFAESGVTILITTHFMDEAEYCDRLVLMSQGEVLAQGSPAEIRQRCISATQPEPSMEDAFIQLIEEHEQALRRSA